MEIPELVKTVRPYSMATEERLTWMAQTAKRVIDEQIPGDFVECGVCNGGSAAILAHYAKLGGRKLHLFDSFKGLPKTTANDVASVTGHSAEKEIGRCLGSIGEVMHVMRKTAGDDFLFNVWKGWFHETFPVAVNKIDKIAMANFDSDWWASEKLCWETWYSKLSVGGYIYTDDYFYWPGCKQAADEFFKSIEVNPNFGKIGHSAWHRKQR
jgi:Macrocin-O-methyltransferase (TylF)